MSGRLRHPFVDGERGIHPNRVEGAGSLIKHLFGDREREGGIQSDPSGHRGTAISREDPSKANEAVPIYDRGIAKQHLPLHSPLLTFKAEKARMCLHMTSNPQTFGGTTGFSQNYANTHLRAIYLVDFTVDSGLVDSATAAFPGGPLQLEYSDAGCREIGNSNHSISTLDSPRVTIPFHFQAGDTNIQKSGFEKIPIHISKDATCAVKHPRLTLMSATNSLITFTHATFTFILVTTSWQ